MTEKYTIHSDALPPVFSPSLVLTQGSGDYVFDQDGKKYVDLTGGIAVNAFGHRWDIIGPAVKRQMEKIIHCSNYFTTQPHMDLCGALVALANKHAAAAHFRSAFICNSGTEANEAALKFARLVARRSIRNEQKTQLIFLSGAFHGRTMGALSVTARAKYKKDFEPLIPGCVEVEYNNSAQLIKAVSDNTAALIVEAVQGEGGLAELSADFAETITQLQRQYRFLLIADEIQAGLFRTGDAFAFTRNGLLPDIITLAKSLGGGLPIGAAIMSDAASVALSPGDHGSTMGGNPVACAAANAVLKKLSSKITRLRIEQSAKYLDKKLAALVASVQRAKNNAKNNSDNAEGLRPLGRGHLRGLALPPQCSSDAVLEACRKKGLLVLKTGENALRIAPSLLCEESAVDKGMKILRAALLECMGHRAAQ